KATVDDRYPSLIDLITVKLIAASQGGVWIIYVAVRVEAPSGTLLQTTSSSSDHPNHPNHLSRSTPFIRIIIRRSPVAPCKRGQASLVIPGSVFVQGHAESPHRANPNRQAPPPGFSVTLDVRTAVV